MSKTDEIIFTVSEAPEGGYTARALGYSIFTEGDTIDEVKRNIKDAIDCHFDETMVKPKMAYIHYVRNEILSLV